MVPRAQGEGVHKAQTSDHLDPLPDRDGVAGVDVVVVSIRELLLSDDRPDYVVCSDRARSNGRWQTVQVQSVWGRSVHCAMQ